uniref:Vesicular, overexpressed in cancer, prosurvival protein 1 n=1 Tax=Panagrolaimus davidi TaxID=227884 RepID=A0A914Q829_9BILA
MRIFWAILLFACISRALADEDCGDGYYCESRFAYSVVCCGDNECCYSLAAWVYVLIAVGSLSVCVCSIILGVRRRNARARAAAAAPSQPPNIPMANVNTGPPPQNNNIPYTIPASGNYYQQNVSQPQAMPMQQPAATMPFTNPYSQPRAKSNYEGSEWE